MLTIQCETTRFEGPGQFVCRTCETLTPLPDGLSAFLLVLPGSQVVLDAETGARLHDCTGSAAYWSA